LGATLAAIDRNRGGIDHLLGEPLGLSKAMQPEAFATGVITTDHGRSFRQSKAPVSLGEVWEQARLVTRCDRALTRLVPRPRGAAELPGLCTQCKRHQQDPL
jgi:hypothetical protein